MVYPCSMRRDAREMAIFRPHHCNLVDLVQLISGQEARNGEENGPKNGFSTRRGNGGKSPEIQFSSHFRAIVRPFFPVAFFLIFSSPFPPQNGHFLCITGENLMLQWAEHRGSPISVPYAFKFPDFF